MDAAADAESPPPASAPRWQRPRPIAAYLLLLALVTLVPAFLYAALVLQRNNEAQQEVVQSVVSGTAGSIAHSADRALSSMLTTLRVLSTLPSLQEGDLESFHRRARAALAGSATYMILLDADLRQLINTRVDFGTALGSGSEPASARRALEERAPVVSDVFFGRTAQAWVFNVVLPVTRDDGADQLLILTQNADNLAATLQSQQLPRGWKVALLDPRGAVVAATDPGVPTGEPFFLAAAGDPDGRFARKTVDGRDFQTVVQPLLNADWKVVLWAPQEILRAPFRRSFMLLVVGGLAIAVVAALAAWGLSRRISRAVSQLARDAERLGASEEVEPIASPIREIVTVSAALSEASKLRKATENQIRFLMHEVAHRSKNQLAVIAAIAKQTAKGSDSVAAFEDSFQKRLQGLARSTDLMVMEGAAGVELQALIEAQIEPFRPSEAARVSIDGPRRRLNIHSAQMLGMAVHELATNAAKYGCFAGVAGVLEIDWSEQGGRLRLLWRERGAGTPVEGGRSGFGTMVIERMVGQSLSAEVERRFHADGVEWRFSIPLESLQGGPKDAAERHPELQGMPG